MGIALVDLNRETTLLLRVDAATRPTDVAVSPSGRRIAFIRDGYLWIAQPQADLEMGKPAAPTPVDAGTATP